MSKYQDLRAGLVSLITARLATDGVTDVVVTEYAPLAPTREDRIWLGEIRGRQEPYTQGAAGLRKEELEVELEVYAPYWGNAEADQSAAEQRSELIFASVENAVRADITVGGVVYNIELDSFTSKVEPDDDGPVGVVEATLVAEAHI